MGTVNDRKERREPQRMGDVVAQLMARRGYARVLAQSQYEVVWQEIVGSDIARQTRLGQVHRSVLNVFVQHSVLMQELTFRKLEIVKKLQAALGAQAPKDLRFRVGADL